MKTRFLVNADTGREYRVVKINREAGIVTLKGETAEFEQKFEPAQFEAWGYKLVVRDVEPEPKAS
jgi:hypothetical protein